MKVNKQIIKRFIQDKFSFRDYLSVSSYFEKEEYDDMLRGNLLNEWNETNISASREEQLNGVLDKIHHQINLTNRPGASKLYQLVSKIAVILILPAFITIAILSYQSIVNLSDDSWVEIVSPVGARTQFHLPDGSEGWLNSGSTIRYPVAFKNHRNVEISGEVWFDVAHQMNQEFVVATPYFNITVLGTQFNVVAYGEEETAEVTLERGKVLVEGKTSNFKSELIPDQQLAFYKSSKKVIKTNVDSKTLNSWRTGLLVFKNLTMGKIATRLERKYNVDIILHGDELKESVFRATFQDESIEEIMSMLATVAPISYEIHKREALPDNTFAKGKIEVWLKK